MSKISDFIPSSARALNARQILFEILSLMGTINRQSNYHEVEKEMTRFQTTAKSALFFGGLLLSAAPQAKANDAPLCNATLEYLLEINVNVPDGVGKVLTGVAGRSFNQSNHIIVTEFVSAGCYPNDACVLARIQLEDVPDDVTIEESNIKIRKDGEVIPWLFEPHRFESEGMNMVLVVAEAGNCEVVCEQGETLFEIDAIPKFHGLEWHLEDMATAETIVQCQGRDSEYTASICDWDLYPFYEADYHTQKVCLPTNGCYRLVVHVAHQWRERTDGRTAGRNE